MTMTSTMLCTFLVLLHAAVFVLPFRLLGTNGRFSQQPQQQQQQHEQQHEQHDSIYFRLYSSAVNEPPTGIQHKTYRKYEEFDQGLVLDDFGQLLEGISLFAQIFGDLDIPLKFEIPAQDPWPGSLHGMRLGKRLEKLFTSSEFFDQHPDKVKEISRLGLKPNVRSLIDDWALLHKSMQIYKKIHGNLRISSKFVVPDEEPWPRLSRNLKLGIRVAAIRSAGRYVKDHPERKLELDEMGFEWRLRDHSQSQQAGEDIFSQVFDALVIYKDTVNAELNVPVSFVVPADEPWPAELHRLKLGALVQGIREEDKLVFGHSDRVQKLTELGFPWEETSRSLYSKKRFDLIYAAMVQYKELYGDLFVPQSFIVPKDPAWPEPTWDLKLGARVNAIRSQGTFVATNPERREKLDKLDFSWELPSEIKRRKRIMNRQETEGGGGVDDLQTDDLPRGPKATPYNLEEGESRRQNGISAERPFGYGVTQWATDEDEEDAPAAATATATATAAHFVAEGVKTKAGLESAGTSAAKRIRNMNQPGRIAGVPKSILDYDHTLVFEPMAYREVAAEAMREYMLSREYSLDPDVRQVSHFEGHLQPQFFNKAITRVMPQEDMDALRVVGYRIVEFGKFNWDKVMEALVIYKAAYGTLDVPIAYVVDDAVVDAGVGFDESFEDLNLGDAVAAIRQGDVDGLEDPERMKQLQQLGFVWEYKLTRELEVDERTRDWKFADLSEPIECDWRERYQRYRFFPMLLGLKIYKHLYGFPMPMPNFVIPSEPQWPYWMEGMPLGEWSYVARIQQNMIKKHYPHRYSMLDAMDFQWWLPPPQNEVYEKYFTPLSSVREEFVQESDLFNTVDVE